jgi:PEP-CTERM motif
MKFHPLYALCTLTAAACLPQAQAHEVTYNVTQTFNQVVYESSHPTWDTIFTGTFDFNEHTGEVSNLQGSLTQAMTGNTVSRQLSHQLSSVYDATLGGYIVTSFLLNSTDVFVGGGFAVGGSTTIGNQNAYATIFVNATAPTAALTSAQIDKLAYADCTDGSLMMGNTKCMTGWVNHAKSNLAGGTMQGTYPITQSITAAVPEPESLALALAGLGVLGAMRRRARA